ncbi:MAG: sialidase family protein [Chloroflexota bacterium]
MATIPDPRHIRHGALIPSEGYADQPYIVRTDDGAWLCVLTTGAGREGAQGQHVVSARSTDHGATWSALVALEPADGPEASYAVLLKVPEGRLKGRIYCFYNHNTDNLRAVRADDPPYPGGLCYRVDSQGHFVAKYSDDGGRSWSAQRYDIPIRAMDIDWRNAYGGDIRFFWNVGKPFVRQGAAYVSLHKVGGFGHGFFTRSEGVLLKSPNLLSEPDPARATWETLPDGDYGLRTPPGGGTIAEEQS